MQRFLILLLCMALLTGLAAQRKRDPLTPAEVDQLREYTQEPKKRIEHFLKFAQARLVAVQQLRGDPKLAQGRGKQVHDLLEDFDFIAIELSENIDMYDRQRSDLRKPLKKAIEAYSDWQLRLRGIKETYRSDPKLFNEYKELDFALDSAIETVNSGLDDAREMLDEQNKAFEKKKK